MVMPFFTMQRYSFFETLDFLRLKTLKNKKHRSFENYRVFCAKIVTLCGFVISDGLRYKHNIYI